MQLYSADNSNFGARVAIAALAKGIALDRAAIPAGGLRSAEFLALNPVAKIPVLVLEDGAVLAESEVIIRYLDDRFPQPALLPEAPADRARVNLVCRLLDLYVMAPIIRLFPQLDPAARDSAIIADEVARLQAGLDALDKAMTVPLPTAAAGVTLADCLLAPVLPLITRICALLDVAPNPLLDRPALVAYYRRCSRHPLISPAVAALLAAQAAKDAQYGLPDLTDHHRRLGTLDPAHILSETAST